jgi:hypothetical protein
MSTSQNFNNIPINSYVIMNRSLSNNQDYTNSLSRNTAINNDATIQSGTSNLNKI